MEEKNNKKEIVLIPLDEIIPNRFQPRLAFDEKELNELANSILKYGIIQPIVVRQIGEKYEIIAGERRYKASTMAGIKKIPAIINNTDDNTSAEIALLENLQRKNLTVIEEAKSFKKLIDRGFKQETIASKLGISQSSIANKIRLLSLPKSVQNSLLYNKISERHARCLLTLPDEQTQKDMLDRIVKERLTVKQTEEEVSKIINKDNNIEEVTEPKIFDPSGMQVSFKLSDMPPLEYFDPSNLNEPVATTEPVLKEEIEKINNNFEKNINNRIEEETKKILDSINNKTDDSDESEGDLKIVPNIDILPDNIENNEPINPFQENARLINQILNKNTQEELKEKINNSHEKSVGNINTFSGTINKIRECINSFDNTKVNTTEIDMDKKYRIIIEIDKDAF